MAGGNFQNRLVIRGGRISPSGVLGVVDGEKPDTLYVWVFQPGDDVKSGAAVIAFQDATGFDEAGELWTTRADAVHEGQLRSGPAIGMALAISTIGERTKVHWWSEAIELVDE